MKNQKILILCCGTPRCGKSTWAKSTGLPICNPDSIRMVLHGTPFRQEAEPLVWATARIMVEALFEAGHNAVILDATNTLARRRAEWKSPKWNLRFKVFDTSEEICIERAIANGQDYLVPVIRRMAKQLELPTEDLLTQTEEDFLKGKI